MATRSATDSPSIYLLYQNISTCANYAQKKAYEVYQEAQQPGALQQKVYAFARSTLGIACICSSKYSALLGAAAVCISPNIVKPITQAAEGAITGIWDKMSFNVKVGGTAAGIILNYYGYSFFDLPCSIIAATSGAEMMLKALGKEEIAHLARQKEAELNDESKLA